MNKLVNISITAVISVFLATNLHLLFSEKSIISKSIYVNEYERMTSGDFDVQLPKEGLLAPEETYTIDVGNHDGVESWLVKEGDSVQVGTELAVLNIEQTESQRSVWESEQNILEQQKSEVHSRIASLQSERRTALANNSSSLNENRTITNQADEEIVEVDLNVDVNVSPDGSYAQAISAAEQELADIVRHIVVLEAQLEQNSSRPALISPVDGIVSKVTRQGSAPAIEIYSTQKIIVTYAKENEWSAITEGLRVLIQGTGTEGIAEGTVLSIAAVPSTTNIWLNTYKALDPYENNNPLAYYEVRILVEPGLESIPYGNNLNAIVIVDEALDAVSVHGDWLRNHESNLALGTVLNNSGRAVEVKLTTAFTSNTRWVVTDGLQIGDVVVNSNLVTAYQYDYTPRIFLPMPTYLPDKKEWKSFGWKNYLKYATIK